MSEKRFTIHKENMYKEDWYDYPFCIKEDGEVVLETIPLYIAEKVRDKLNEQQTTIDEQKIIIEERDVANERLNRFLNEIGLEKEYIKWEFKKGVLNELNEENDVLKQQLKTKYVVNKQYEELQRLKKDNKELKKENKRLAKNLKVAKNNVDANFKSAQYWRQKFEAIPENIRMVWTE